MTKRQKANPSGEWWIEGDGQAIYADGETSDTNHEIEAFNSAIGLDYELLEEHGEYINANGIDEKTLGEFYAEEHEIEVGEDTDLSALGYKWLEEHGADMKFVEYVQSGFGDVRTWMMKTEGWIRVQGNNFQLWEFDAGALDNIVSSDIWEQEVDTEDGASVEESDDEVYIEELSNGAVYTIMLRDLFKPGATVDQLKLRSAGQEWDEIQPKKVKVWPKQTGDEAGEKQWLYRRKGDNPRSDVPEKTLPLPFDNDDDEWKDLTSSEGRLEYKKVGRDWSFRWKATKELFARMIDEGRGGASRWVVSFRVFDRTPVGTEKLGINMINEEARSADL